MYERHRYKISSLYETRMQALNEAVERYNEEGVIEAFDIRSGIYMPFRLKPTVNTDRLTKRLDERNIRVVTGKAFYLSDYLEREKFLRISVSQTDPERIHDGVRAIIEEVGKVTRVSFSPQ